MNIPIRYRLAIWFAALMCVAFAVFSLAVYVVTSNALESNLDSTIRQRAINVVSTIGYAGGNIALPHAEELADQPSASAVVFGRNGKVLTGNLPAEVGERLGSPPTSRLAMSGFDSAGGYRFDIRAVTHAGHTGGYVLVWQSLGAVDDARHSLLLILLAVGPIVIAFATLGGVLLAGRALVPVSQIAQVASTISVTDLHRRVPVSPAHDELTSLASTFNEMISRLEASVGRERRFTGDASHELRSPLAVIRAEATLALDRPRSEAEYRRALEVIDAQAKEMEGLVQALLSLARAETLSEQDFSSVALDEAVRAAVEQVEEAMPDAGVRIESDVASGLTVEGSGPLLARAIRNVVDNAVRVSAAGSTVWVRTQAHDGVAAVSVEDSGPGIDAEHIAHIFEPFYQVTRARTPGDSHGLGLAICRRIVGTHGGKVTVESVPGHGATFEIVLPLAGHRPAAKS